LKGLSLQPDNPRLLVLAGESAGQLGDAALSPANKMIWYRRAAGYLGAASAERAYFAYIWRERALALDSLGLYDQALPAHLRAIARDPDHARGYEYLAVHFWRQGRPEEARRLFRLAQTLPGSRLAAAYLEEINKGRESF
jgi:tetratricopeptide (TPR) repeat protein